MKRNKNICLNILLDCEILLCVFHIGNSFIKYIQMLGLIFRKVRKVSISTITPFTTKANLKCTLFFKIC